MPLARQDLAILLVSFVAIFLSLQQQGNIAIEASWYEEVDASGTTYRNGHAPDPSEKLPLPIVTDLDGDGIQEIIVATREPSIKVLKMRDASDTGTSYQADWDEVDTVYSANLLSNVIIRSGRQPAALATGYIHPYNSTRARQQIVVVVTEGWNVLCFDHTLKLLWENSVEADFTNKYLGEVGILIDSHQMRIGDKGVVIVGGRLAARHDLDHYDVHADGVDFEGKTIRQMENELDDEYEYEDDDNLSAGLAVDVEEEDDEFVMADSGETSANPRDENDHFEESKQFTFYAFEGLTGVERWHHAADDFFAEDHAHDILRPQHDVHSGEMDWRNFRYSILDSLPHRWASREDTLFELAHYERRRSGKERQSKVAMRQSAYWHTELLGLQPHSDSEHVKKPNTLVAHLSDGIEVIHLYTGRTVCRLTLGKEAVHADINGDGVIDHIQTIGGSHTPFFRARSGHSAQFQLPRCMNIVNSGIPPSHQLFNGSICKTTLQESITKGLAGISPEDEPDDIKVAHAVALPIPNNVPRSIPKYQSIFFVNDGHVTSYGPYGKQLWQTPTRSLWLKDNMEAAEMKLSTARRRKKKKRNKGKLRSQEELSKLRIQRLSMHATAIPFPLFADADEPDHIAVVGEKVLTILAGDGTLMKDTQLLDIPITHAVYGDFNNDQINDIIVTTTAGYYGFTITRRLGSKLFTILVAFLVVLLGITFVVKLNSGNNADARRRRKGGRAE